MTEAKETYLKEMDSIREIYVEEKSRIVKEYAKSVCPYHKGDKVHDAVGWICVDKVLVTYRHNDFPRIEVEGIMLTRHKEVRVDGKRRRIDIVNLLKE